MKLRTLLLLLPTLAAAQTSSAQQPAQAPGVGAAASLRSPEVSAPKASAVSVICECLTLEEAATLEKDVVANAKSVNEVAPRLWDTGSSTN